MDVAEVEAWCSRKQLAVEHAVVLSGVRSEITDDTLLQALDLVKVLGKAKIVDRCLDTVSKTQFILIQTSTDLTQHTIPERVGIPDGAGPWPAQVLPAAGKSDEFEAKLLSFLRNEGKTISDVKGLAGLANPSPAPSPLDMNTALINVLSSLVDKCNTVPSETQSYRKLRMFSGERPVPIGEEEYDAWAEQTGHLLEEWQCNDGVKRQRIVESLKGSAADIVRFLRAQNPTATSHDYMQALETAFGTTESPADLLMKFRQTFQCDGEKLSTYLLRLDKLLHCVFRKGGVGQPEMNQLRIEQVVRGALPHDMTALRIRMTHKLRAPPTFYELLKEVREEEDMLQSRNDVRSTVTSKTVIPIPMSTPENSVNTEVEQLKKDISVMKAELISLRTAAAEAPPKQPNTPSEFPSKARYRRNETTQRASGEESRSGIFCYRCGEDGHFKRECEGEENLKKVNNRLIKLRKPTGNYRGNQ